MIAFIKGRIISKSTDSAVIENSGIGYEVFLCRSSLESLVIGEERELFVAQSFSMYEGALLYAFLSPEHRDIFELFRKAIPNTGAKKALDYLNKTLKSPMDFKKAVINNDVKLLTGIFGFTGKTAEKIIAAIKDSIAGLKLDGEVASGSASFDAAGYGDALNALVSLGYRTSAAREALSEISAELRGEVIPPEQLVKMALRRLAR